jgi:hypothetical protein
LIAVIAAAGDAEAECLVERWQEHGAVRVTPLDLSCCGWSVCFPTAGPRFVGDGEVMDSDDITGVLVRLAVVSPNELEHFTARDRVYAAAEMTAFLSYWLSALSRRCTVVNYPSASFLLGPPWTIEHWLTVAAGLGLPVVEANSDGHSASKPSVLHWVTVVGDRGFGADREAQGAAAALAQRARVRLLGVAFDCQGRVAATSLRPPLNRDAEESLIDIFNGQRR